MVGRALSFAWVHTIRMNTVFHPGHGYGARVEHRESREATKTFVDDLQRSSIMCAVQPSVYSAESVASKAGVFVHFLRSKRGAVCKTGAA